MCKRNTSNRHIGEKRGNRLTSGVGAVAIGPLWCCLTEVGKSYRKEGKREPKEGKGARQVWVVW